MDSSNKTKKKPHVFFDINEMIEFASKTTKQIIIFDEACLSLMGTDWGKKTHQQFKKMLMISRKKGHFWILIIPQVVYLSEYFVIDRAVGLLHVYSQDYISRGNFVYFNKKDKDRLYHSIKKTKIRNYKNYSFRGKFVSKFCIDKETYEEKKDNAINSLLDEEEMNCYHRELLNLKYHIAMSNLITTKLKSELTGYSTRVIYDWKHYKTRYKDIINTEAVKDDDIDSFREDTE